MRAIILAAGRGRRLASMGWDKPKCLLEINGRTLLARTLDALAQYRVTDVAMVVGYRRDLVEAEVGQSEARVTFIENTDYESTNTINSLWLARDFLTDDALCFNSDVLFDPEIVGLLLDAEGTALAVDVKPCGGEEVKVVVDSADRIMRIGKALSPSDCLGEFIGIAKFIRATGLALVGLLRRYNEELRQRDLLFEAAVDDLAHEHELRALRLGDLRAVEIDTPQDYETAKRQW